MEEFKREFGDVILQINYDAFERVREYPLLIEQKSDGEQIELTLEEAKLLVSNLQYFIGKLEKL